MSLLRALSRTAKPRSMRPPLISVIGATGTGKSQVTPVSVCPSAAPTDPFQLAVELALSLNGEVINADAMQLYRGLPIITNKITDEERKDVPHHLLGVLDTKDVWQVGRFIKEAEKTVCVGGFCCLGAVG
jgi:tRNA dimethylallyltransferase